MLKWYECQTVNWHLILWPYLLQCYLVSLLCSAWAFKFIELRSCTCSLKSTVTFHESSILLVLLGHKSQALLTISAKSHQLVLFHAFNWQISHSYLRCFDLPTLPTSLANCFLTHFHSSSSFCFVSELISLIFVDIDAGSVLYQGYLLLSSLP